MDRFLHILFADTACLGRRLMTFRGVVLCVVLGLHTGLTPCVRADESVWKGYQATALQAEREENSVLAERAWRVAQAETNSMEANDPRRFVSLAHLALAQIDTQKLTEARTTISQAEAQFQLLDPNKLGLALPATVHEALGTLDWARGRMSDATPYSLDRAKYLASAVTELSTQSLPPARFARLCKESSLAQRSVGHATVALRHVDLALAAVRSEQSRDHRLAEALILRSLLLVELARPAEATTELMEWKIIHQELKDKKSKDLPEEAAYWWVLARQALANSDGVEAQQHMAYFRLGSAEVQHPRAHSLVTSSEILATAIEIQLLRGEPVAASGQVAQLQTLAPPGTASCGRALYLDAVVQLHLGQLSKCLTRLVESQTQLTAELGAGHPRHIPGLLTLALVHSEAGRSAEAISAAKRSIQLANKFWPAGHPERIRALAALARAELQRQHGDESRQFARGAWDMTVIPWPPTSPNAALVLGVLTEAEAQTKSPDAAAHLAALESAKLEDMSPFERGLLQLHRARAAHFLGQQFTAASSYRNAIQQWEACQSPTAAHPYSATALLGFAIIDDRGQDKPGAAFRAAREALMKLRGTTSAIALELSQQGNAFYTADRFEEAIWLYERAIDEYTSLEGSTSTSAQSIRAYRDRANAKIRERP